MTYYRTLLGVSASNEPNYFELLAVAKDETDPKVIKKCAKLQLAKLPQHSNGRHAEVCKKIAKEINRAYRVLSDPDRRARYLVKLESQSSFSKDAEISDNTEEVMVPVTMVPSSKQQPSTLVVEHSPQDIAAGAKNPDSRVKSPNGQMETRDDRRRVKKWQSIVIPFACLAALALIATAVSVFWQPTTALVDNTGPNGKSTSIESSDPIQVLPIEKSLEREVRVASTVKPIKNPVAAAPAEIPSTELPTEEPKNRSSNKGRLEEGNLSDSSQTPLADETQESQRDESQTQPAFQGNLERPATIADSATSDSKLAITTTKQQQSSPQQKSSDELAQKAKQVLSKSCFRCHGKNQSEEGGFDFVLDYERLIATNFVRPNSPDNSPLLERMESRDDPMPPEGEAPRPSAADMKDFEAWIKAGAPSFDAKQQNRFVTNEEIHQWIADDIQKVEEEDRKYVRYFGATHLYNTGDTPQELEVIRQALAKLVNSLSWNKELVSIVSIDPLQTIYRFDLRSAKWDRRVWETLAREYPYGIKYKFKSYEEVVEATGTRVPLIRADWFVATASRPPVYHELIQMPDNDETLEKILSVDVETNIGTSDAQRIGFARSGVSQNNRMIERHEARFGAYWKSYDFAGNDNKKIFFDFLWAQI